LYSNAAVPRPHAGETAEPAAIDEPALEDLARFVLGESKAFLHRAPLAHVNSRRA
jgi:hypothetical protein